MKRNKRLYSASVWVVIILVAAVVGVSLGVWSSSEANTSGFNIISWSALLFMLLWLVLATFLHELGHLLMGYATGYKFVFFKLFGVIFYKHGGKWTTMRDKANGAIGQCLMQPDFPYGDKMPYVLYNIGGVLMNIVCAAILVAFVFIYSANDFAVTGIIVNGIFFLINAIPARSLQNDGYNVLEISRGAVCKKAYYTELKTTAAMLEGKTFSDMAEEMFDFDTDGVKYPAVCSALYISYCYLVSSGKQERADGMIEALYAKKDDMPLSHANTFSVEYFNNLILFRDDRVKAAELYNSFDMTIKNAIQRTPVPFTVIARMMVNALSAHDDRRYTADRILLEKIIDYSRNAAEAEYLGVLLRKAGQRWAESAQDPFDL